MDRQTNMTNLTLITVLYIQVGKDHNYRKSLVSIWNYRFGISILNCSIIQRATISFWLTNIDSILNA